MSPLLNVIIALGGASFAWRAYSSLYERQRHRSQLPDSGADTWWRILSMAVAAGLVSFVLGVVGAALRGPRALAVVLLWLLATAAFVALVGAVALWRRASR
jgi:hypothetical protein